MTGGAVLQWTVSGASGERGETAHRPVMTAWWRASGGVTVHYPPFTDSRVAEIMRRWRSAASPTVAQVTVVMIVAGYLIEEGQMACDSLFLRL